LKLNVKLRMKVDGKLMMEMNLTADDWTVVSLFCDKICGIHPFGMKTDPQFEVAGLEEVEPIFRRDR